MSVRPTRNPNGQRNAYESTGVSVLDAHRTGADSRVSGTGYPEVRRTAKDVVRREVASKPNKFSLPKAAVEIVTDASQLEASLAAAIRTVRSPVRPVTIKLQTKELADQMVAMIELAVRREELTFDEADEIRLLRPNDQPPASVVTTADPLRDVAPTITEEEELTPASGEKISDAMLDHEHAPTPEVESTVAEVTSVEVNDASGSSEMSEKTDDSYDKPVVEAETPENRKPGRRSGRGSR